MNTEERVCSDLNEALDELRGAGFRLDSIYPADDPHTALLSRGAESVRLTTRPGSDEPGERPPFIPEFVLTRAQARSGQGRAGMLYDDLIPGRLGGRYIASRISIPAGGPVADWVHYHHIEFQLIVVRRGWVKVVYEDQGDPFVLHAGDLVLQPPGIRHRVIESSAELEVIEITCPAVHETFAEHDMELPNGVNPDRSFGGQRFVRHIGAEVPWLPSNGGEIQRTAIGEATEGLANVNFVRAEDSSPIYFAANDGELVFGFLLDGSAHLDFGGGYELLAGDAFVIPPGEPWRLSGASGDFRLLHVTTRKLG